MEKDTKNEEYTNHDIDSNNRGFFGKMIDKIVSPQRRNYLSVLKDLSDKNVMKNEKIMVDAFKDLHGKTNDYLNMKQQEKSKATPASNEFDYWVNRNKEKDGWAKLIASDPVRYRDFFKTAPTSMADCIAEVARQLTLCTNSRKATSFPTNSVKYAIQNVCTRIIVLLMKKTIEKHKEIFNNNCDNAKQRLTKTGEKAIGKCLKTEIKKLMTKSPVSVEGVEMAMKFAAYDLATALNTDKKFEAEVIRPRPMDSVFADDYFTLKKKEDTSHKK